MAKVSNAALQLIWFGAFEVDFFIMGYGPFALDLTKNYGLMIVVFHLLEGLGEKVVYGESGLFTLIGSLW